MISVCLRFASVTARINCQQVRFSPLIYEETSYARVPIVAVITAKTSFCNDSWIARGVAEMKSSKCPDAKTP